MNPRIVKIAASLKERYLAQFKSRNKISIFLCGGSSLQEARYRRELGTRISKVISKYRYYVYYPEDMFIELILGPDRHDLLTLENILATSVSVVVILLQSPGTFTELGAFTNYRKLKDKLIVVVDPKYEHARSFINYGPIRYLKLKTKSRVLFSPMEGEHFGLLVKILTESARDIAKHSFPSADLSNPILAYRFYLAIVYVFEPIPRESFIEIAQILSDENKNEVKTLAEAILISLINERKLALIGNNMLITKRGIDDLIYAKESKRSISQLSKQLTELRVDALNLTLRKKYTRIWGEAR